MSEDKKSEDKPVAENIYRQKKVNDIRRTALLEGLEETSFLSLLLSLYSKKEIEDIDIKITNANGDPSNQQHGSLYDARMGSSFNSMCSTCGDTDCAGHYGVIDFPERYPIINPIMFGLVINVLRSVCNNCGALLVTKDQINRGGLGGIKAATKRVAKIAELAVKSKCYTPNRLHNSEIKKCSKDSEKVLICPDNPEFLNHNPKKDHKVLYKGSNSQGVPMEMSRIYNIFHCITKEHVELMGFEEESRPEDLLMFGIVVMPPISRPFVPSATTGTYMANDLTKGYEDIIKTVNKFAITENPDQLHKQLFFNVKRLLEGKKSKNTLSKTRAYIGQMLQGKKSAFRHNLMGKSTNRCARTVIGPDTSLRLTEIGVPQEWAKILTMKEVVTQENYDFLLRLFKEGRITHIVDSEGKGKGLKRLVKEGVSFPSVGSKVYRHMMNGDIVVINRQPTLHKFSMMAFEVVLKDQRNITLSVPVTTPYNADFDGDEMNMWVEELIGARVEAHELMFVAFNAHSTTKNKPTMGLVYDAITASYLLTDEEEISPGLYCSIRDKLTQTSYLADLDQRLLKYHINPLSGKGVFSMLFPPDFNYFNGGVNIVDGVLVSGRLTDAHVSHASGSIVEKLFLEYGPDYFIDFLTDGSYMVLEYITETGFSVGISDCVAMEEAERLEEEHDTEKTRQKIQSLVDMVPRPGINASKIEHETYEKTISDIIRQHETAGFEAIKAKTAKTAIGEMMSDIGGGAKGKPFNIRQIRKMLAGQFYRGRRLAGPTCPTRATPGYDIGESDIRAAGFITSSFMQGLTPDEHFMHMLAGREGLIDTAINVSSIGDLHRKIVKSLENLHIGLNGSVINNSGIVFQLIYGGDGLDPGKIIKVKPKGSTDGFASFIDPYKLAADLNIKNGWIPSTVKEGIEKRAKITEERGEDLEEKIDQFRTGRGRGMGLVTSRLGNKGIRNKRVQLDSAQRLLNFEKELEAKEQAKMKERSKSEVKPASSSVVSLPPRKLPAKEETPLSTYIPLKKDRLEKKDISEIRAPVAVKMAHILSVKSAVKNADIETIKYKRTTITIMRDSETFRYGTFVRGLDFFLRLKKEDKTIVTWGRSDSIFLPVISYLAALAKIELTMVVNIVEDKGMLEQAKIYGPKIEGMIAIDPKKVEDKVETLVRSSKNVYQLDSNLEDDDYIEALSLNIGMIKENNNLDHVTKVYLKQNFKCISKAVLSTFKGAVVETDINNIKEEDLVLLNF